jgi:phosphoribosylformylglycinamidine synthase
MASGVGAAIDAAGDHGFWFGEDQSRYVVAVTDGAAFLAAAKAAGVPARKLGHSVGGDLVLGGVGTISVARLAAAHEATLPLIMQGI